MNENTEKVLNWARELQALSTAGLFYTKNDFDRERFQHILDIAAEMTDQVSDEPLEEIQNLFQHEYIYQTPKIDSRSILFDEADRVLLVQELDGTWAPPGGWCEYDLHPAANAVKECREEAGLEVEPYRLVAVHDQRLHNEPYEFYTVIRMLYLCRLKGGAFHENIETLNSGWFSLDALPELNCYKVSPDQLRLCLEANHAETWETRFDRP
ncbi:MAG: NUDIX hydrolase N-terminal domain-containing protein [Clostridiales bacterium]|nr:NUDIX hydrolase N-terminal domain-containing protein [Clostridiales bacterium]